MFPLFERVEVWECLSMGLGHHQGHEQGVEGAHRGEVEEEPAGAQQGHHGRGDLRAQFPKGDLTRKL